MAPPLRKSMERFCLLVCSVDSHFGWCWTALLLSINLCHLNLILTDLSLWLPLPFCLTKARLS